MQTKRVRGTATSVYESPDVIQVKYHDTVVVEITHNRIVLNTGGWKTTTTKRRMNQASNQYGLRYWVYQTRGLWFVHYGGKDLAFKNDELVLIRE
jgi:hypothetical protein